MFSDESRFYLQQKSGRIRVYRRKGERYLPQCIVERDSYRGGSVHIWGGITHTGKTEVHLIQGNLTGQRYVAQILTPYVVPYIQRNGQIFQQDNARPHVARVSIDYLQQENIETLPWPSKSTDLNPIEHLWDELERRLRQRQQAPTNLQDLWNAVQEEWNNIPQYKVRKLVASMRSRCQAVIEAQGGHTRY